MTCVGCGNTGKPYATDAMGLPYCKNCVSGRHEKFNPKNLSHDEYAESGLWHPFRPKADTVPAQYHGGSARYQGLTKRAENKRKWAAERRIGTGEFAGMTKDEINKWHDEHPETKEQHTAEYMKHKQDMDDAKRDSYI